MFQDDVYFLSISTAHFVYELNWAKEEWKSLDRLKEN